MSSLPPSSYSPPPGPPQPPYGYPSGFGAYDPAPAKRTLAGWSLALAIFPSCITWVISIVFACIVISRSKDGRDHGKGMAIAALIIVASWVVIAIVVVTVLHATGVHRDENGRVTDGGRASVLDLHLGDCLPAFEAGRARTVEVVECDDPHTAEVYATFDLSGEFTTHDEVTHVAEGGCFDRFEDYVGVRPKKSALHVFYLIPPDRATFDQDPGVTCIAVSDTEVTGSLKGTGT